MNPELSPYYYPTSIALVDDNQPFLETLSLYLMQFFHCKSFVNAADALRFANLNGDQKDIDNPIFSLKREYKNKDFYRHINMKAQDVTRSQELSVVVVDYDMPELDGIEFCSRLTDPSIRKILLTGRASHQQVVNAFNNNIIDYYIEKQDSSLLHVVRDSVLDMQKAYFNRRLQAMTLSLIKSGSSLFLDSALADFFDDTCLKLGTVEYFYAGGPSRFLLKNKNDQKVLLIYTDEDLDEHSQIIKDEQGPQEWINALNSRHYVPFFQSSDGFYDPDEPNNGIPLYSATVIRGQQTYYCALLDDKKIANTSTINHLPLPTGILH